eukprot:gnl/TRDRNA2_/TRDRNA2_181660_c0_seq1.p1 gnl/TRDRNA2_/TRDRNA2_181660_c0~~gnl/TRDRNA2_/TRDRNA2_181660_c0_seq1.p1  ORF type:complete len:540 (+),score=93.71 gnl/TRDRNA2_/TRDRNA2_181660_c0_seq1:46-1665(+)
MWRFLVVGGVAAAWSLPAKSADRVAKLRSDEPRDALFMFQKRSRLARGRLAGLAEADSLDELADEELLAEEKSIPSVHGVTSSLLEYGSATKDSPWDHFLQRAEEHMRKVVFGLLVLVIANGLLLVIERRRATITSLLERGRKDCQEAVSDVADVQNNGRLVHLAGDVRAAAPVVDSRFPEVRFEDGCVRLRSVVEVYRWIEKIIKEDERDGGDNRPGTTTTYEYSTEWSETFEDSAMFHHRKGHENICPKEVPFGSITKNCYKVALGAFQLPSRMVEAMEEHFEGLEANLPSTLKLAGRTFVREGSGPYFYWRHGGGHEPHAEDQIGDCRVRFSYMPEGPVTIMGLQCRKNGCDTFIPYRLTSQFGDDDERKAALLAEGEKSQSAAAEEWRWLGGRLWWLLAISNLFACADSKVSLGKEIFYLTQRRFGQATCMKEISADMFCGSWSMNSRIICWISMLGAIALSSFPFVTCIDSMPLIKASGDLASCVVIVNLFLTFALTTVALAYVDLDALYAGGLMGAVVAILVLPQLIAMPFVH